MPKGGGVGVLIAVSAGGAGICGITLSGAGGSGDNGSVAVTGCADGHIEIECSVRCCVPGVSTGAICGTGSGSNYPIGVVRSTKLWQSYDCSTGTFGACTGKGTGCGSGGLASHRITVAMTRLGNSHIKIKGAISSGVPSVSTGTICGTGSGSSLSDNLQIPSR